MNPLGMTDAQCYIVTTLLSSAALLGAMMYAQYLRHRNDDR